MSKDSSEEAWQPVGSIYSLKPSHDTFDYVFTNLINRDHCFDLINSQLRKYKLTKCKHCAGMFYPLWEVDGAWITDAEFTNKASGFQEINDSGIDPFNFDYEYVLLDPKQHKHKVVGLGLENIDDDECDEMNNFANFN